MKDPNPLVQWSVLPVISSPSSGHGVLGTSFLVRSAPGYAFTAQHVLAAAPGFTAVAPDVWVKDIDDPTHTLLMLHSPEGWRFVPVIAWEGHPTEDLAAMQLHGRESLPTPRFDVQCERVPVSTTYSRPGYPEVDYWSMEEEGKVDLDLAYSEGHVRRHRASTLPGIRGSHFLELSNPAGGGCSGAPVFARQVGGLSPVPVTAVYVGERRTEGSASSVGYALPSPLSSAGNRHC